MNRTVFVDQVIFLQYYFVTTLIIAILSLLINGSVVYAIGRHLPKLQLQPHQKLILSMSSGEMMLPFLVYWIDVYVSYSKLRSDSTFSQLNCPYHGFMVSFGGYLSIYHITAISVERYISVVKPHIKEYLLNKKKYQVRILIFIWCWPFIIAACPLFGWSSFVPEGLSVVCCVNWQSNKPNDVSYNFFIMVMGYFVPMIVILTTQSSVFTEIKMMGERAKRMAGTMSPLSKDSLRNERQLTILTSMMVVGFNIAWLPYAVLSLVSMILGPDAVDRKVASYPALLAKTSAVYNPLIYAYSSKDFRRLVFGRHSLKGRLKDSNLPKETEKIARL